MATKKLTKELHSARKVAALEVLPAKTKAKPPGVKAAGVKGAKKSGVARFGSPMKDEGFEIVGRLSDAAMRDRVAETVKVVSSNHAAALRLLRGIGVATPRGRLSKRYGG